MAIRTVSNTGGAWQTAATWVGGVKPIVGKDSVAFTITSGPLVIDGNLVPDTSIVGINLTNYRNIITLTGGSSIYIDDQNTSGRSSFVNLGTGGYTFSSYPDLYNGIVVAPVLSQTCTLISNGTTFSYYLELNSDYSGPITISGSWVQNGPFVSGIGVGSILKNGKFTLNGPVKIVGNPDFTDSLYFNLSTSQIIINSDLGSMSSVQLDGESFQVNSPYISTSGGFSLANSLLTSQCIFTISTPLIRGGFNLSNLNNYIITANDVISDGFYYTPSGSGTLSCTNLLSDISVDYLGVNNNLLVTNVFSSSAINTTTPTGILTVSASYIYMNDMNITSGFILKSNQLNSLTGSRFGILSINNTSSTTIVVGSGSSNTYNINSPIISLNKKNNDILNLALTASISASISSTITPTLSNLILTSPLITLDPSTLVNPSTIIQINSTQSTTMNLLSSMTASSLKGVVANTTMLTFTGPYNITIGTMSQFSSIGLVANRTLTITQSAAFFHTILSSNTTGVRAKYHLNNDNNFMLDVVATDIDSTLSTIKPFSFYGTASNCLNWKVFNDMPQVSSTF